MTEKLKEDAYRYAIKNAFLHDGKADAGAVVGKIAALEKEIDLKKAMPFIIEAVKKVNAMSLREIKKEFEKFEAIGYELKPQEKKEGLPELDWAKKEKVVTRFAPNPNGPFHLGSARAAILSYEYAEKYGGKFILRFDDTDPKVKQPIPNAEELFKEDLKWLGITPAETYFASERLQIYYDFMQKLIEKGGAYVCHCNPEEWRKKITKGEACPCREKPAKEQLKEFEKMLKNELKEGQAVLRVKTDLKHKDPSVRDWWAAKIVDNPIHTNPEAAKQHVWPSYNFASAIDDHELGVTLIIRGQEHAQNQTKQEFLYKYFGWKYPHTIHFGRVMLEGVVLSTSKIKEGIEKGEFIGWDDPRLGTIRAFRRRGFTPKALKQAILEVGIKSSDTTIEMKNLVALNKEVLKGFSKLTFIQEPIRLDVTGTPRKEVEIDLKHFVLKEGIQQFVVSKKDFEKIDVGNVFRLRNAYNVKLTDKGEYGLQGNFVGDTKTEPIVHWLVKAKDVEVMMPDASKVLGVTEEAIAAHKVGEHLEFEKFGFVRIDEVGGKTVKVWFTHR